MSRVSRMLCSLVWVKLAVVAQIVDVLAKRLVFHTSLHCLDTSQVQGKNDKVISLIYLSAGSSVQLSNLK